MATSIFPLQYRNDSTILPVITSDLSLDFGYTKIDGWLYLPMADSTPLSFIPPNRTQQNVPVTVKNCLSPTLTLSAGVNRSVNTILRTSGEGYAGAYSTDVLDRDNCSVQAETSSDLLTSGISLYDNTDTVSHDYNAVTVRHALLFGQRGQGTIFENGVPVSNNAYFKYETGDTGLIEVIDGSCFYYLIKPDGTMKLLRRTRSKLTMDAKAEFLLYFTGSSLKKCLLWNGESETTSFENIGVAYFQAESKELYWQNYADQRASQSTGESIELADKRTATTYSNEKRRVITMSLNPKAFSLSDYWKFQDFVYHHDTAREFIFIDYARKDLDGNPIEFWAKFTGAFLDQTRNGCQFNQSQSIIEDFRNDYVAPLYDETPPEVEITSLEEGSVILSGTASDNVRLIHLLLYHNNRPYGNKFLPELDGTWTVTVPTEDLEAGVNSFYVIATDYARNHTQSNTMTYDADATAPTASLSANQYDGLFLGIIGESNDNSGTCRIQPYLNGDPYGSDFENPNGELVFAVSTADLIEGWNEFKVSATDAIGNQTFSEIYRVLVNIDTIAPENRDTLEVSSTSNAAMTFEWEADYDAGGFGEDSETFLVI